MYEYIINKTFIDFIYNVLFLSDSVIHTVYYFVMFNIGHYTKNVYCLLNNLEGLNN